MKAKITVTLKPQVLDPQGKAVLNGLHSLGFEDVRDIRQGKIFYLTLDPAKTQDDWRPRLQKIADKLLANPIMENFEIEFLESS